MYNGKDFAFKTIGGKMVIPSDVEVNRIHRENVKAAQAINPAKNAWAYWGKFNEKQAKKIKGN